VLHSPPDPEAVMNTPDPNAETQERQKTRRRAAPWLFGGLTLLLLTALVLLQVFGLWEIFTPETARDTLLIYALSSLNFVAFFLFTFIFVRSLLKLRRERRERQLGSKIKTRLVVYFIAVSLLPITAMALFSYMFFNRTLEKYFSPFPQDVARQAKQAREERAREELESLRELAAAAAPAGDQAQSTFDAAPTTSAAAPALSHYLTAAGLAFVFVAEPDGKIREFQSRVSLTDEAVAELYRRGLEAETGAFEFAGGGPAFNAAAARTPGGRLLVVGREPRGGQSLVQLAAGAQTFEDFRRNQRKVRLLGLSTLGLLTLMLLFAATWSAIHLARGIGQPIRALSEAAREVAGGNLEHRVTAIADDELAVLASAFNEMTAELAENRRRLEQNAAELREKNLALDERRGYIEAVLQTVATGVISLDEQNRVTTINAAALSMLRLAQAPAQRTPLAEVVSAEDYAVLENILGRARRRGRATEQLELARGAAPETGEPADAPAPGVVPVALTATALAPREGERGRGVVLVIEDLSELLAAQRAAAWSEVARRLAHEIKNPLTPIQLSAERIARNFRRAGAEGDGATQALASARASGNGAHEEGERVARVVEECTATIAREVAGLKGMVDEFTRYARLPHARLEPGDLNEVVRQAVALYEERLEDVRVDVRLGHSLPAALLDPEQLRRVFVNLLDNSFEALAEAEGERRITVATGHDPARGLLIAEVTDTGHGIARSDFKRLFQPYFSTRGRGTGLGLAIVHRIMAEHGGRIRAEANRPKGARMIIELPVAEEK
jgi:two-component system, NtrC family, nitrogen regulation sensor histidine kinase NtrY